MRLNIAALAIAKNADKPEKFYKQNRSCTWTFLRENISLDEFSLQAHPA